LRLNDELKKNKTFTKGQEQKLKIKRITSKFEIATTKSTKLYFSGEERGKKNKKDPPAINSHTTADIHHTNRKRT